MRALVTGATGFVGGRLAGALAARGFDVRCLVRDRARAQHLEDAGHELHEGDVLDAGSLRGAGEGVSTAYYLVHSMGRGTEREGFADRERRAAANFAEMASAEGVERIVYLGGLGDERSEHLRSRAATAETLAEHGPPLVYFRAAMVIGAGSESYRTVRYLVERLPAMIAPSWLRNRTQPIAIDDVLEYLVQAAERPEAAGHEVQIGGPDVLTYSELLDVMAEVLGKRRRPKVPVPFLTPTLSSHWIGLVTPVDAGVARPLIESLASETIVTDPEPAGLFDVELTSTRDALRQAHEEEDAG
ncbi:MAG TPA: NAD(P)H-binding protein [Thermoleophilaceae bacterium]|nr:NAD(P)H-binding protein [Thermoleophilaceae bacterium]